MTRDGELPRTQGPGVVRLFGEVHSVATRGLQLRLFFTCWLVFGAHHATDFVREHYLVLSIVEDGSFDLTKYVGLHVDIFRNPPTAPHGGAHHGANPGISMVAVPPYLVLKPLVDRIVAREQASRGPTDTLTVYRDETRARRLAFYEATRRMGLDVRFGLVALITTLLCMAPLAAASSVVMFRLFLGIGFGSAAALGLALVYAFATPVFFRASYLNQNLAIAVFSITGFMLLWNAGNLLRLSAGTRQAIAGLMGGLSLLSDYSGGLTLVLLGGYLGLREWQERTPASAARALLRYGLGAAGPVLMLWFYQWQSFGHPFLPPQHWMPPVDWIEIGYQGVGGPTLELFGLLLFDLRFGLFVAAPIMLLAVVSPFVLWRSRRVVPWREIAFCFVLAIAYLVFFSAVQYTRLQWVTGIRYLLPAVPFLFIPIGLTLLRVPRLLSYSLVAVSFVAVWSMTMMRSQTGVLDAVMRTMLEGPRLPALTTFSRMSAQYAPWLTGDASPLPLFALLGILLVAIWRMRAPLAPIASSELVIRDRRETPGA